MNSSAVNENCRPNFCIDFRSRKKNKQQRELKQRVSSRHSSKMFIKKYLPEKHFENVSRPEEKKHRSKLVCIDKSTRE